MRNKLGPWLPAIFCASLSLIAVVANLAGEFMTGKGSILPGDMTFYGFMPMCFYFVGIYLAEIKKENQELRQRIDELTSTTDVVGTTA